MISVSRSGQWGEVQAEVGLALVSAVSFGARARHSVAIIRRRGSASRTMIVTMQVRVTIIPVGGL